MNDKKIVELNLIKKNRKYFAAKTENDYHVKLLIDENSENLELGKHDLLIEDISIRSKYGVDVIYKVVGEVTGKQIVSLKHRRYNYILIERCKSLGGKWDAETKAWIFTSLVENEVEELDYVYNSKEIPIELKAKVDVYSSAEPLYFCGYTIGTATDRDSGAKLADEISVIEGWVTSGGSRINWTTEALTGTIIRMTIPELVLEKHLEDESRLWEIKKL